jgi:hypothetical protein
MGLLVLVFLSNAHLQSIDMINSFHNDNDITGVVLAIERIVFSRLKRFRRSSSYSTDQELNEWKIY